MLVVLLQQEKFVIRLFPTTISIFEEKSILEQKNVNKLHTQSNCYENQCSSSIMIIRIVLRIFETNSFDFQFLEKKIQH